MFGLVAILAQLWMANTTNVNGRTRCTVRKVELRAVSKMCAYFEYHCGILSKELPIHGCKK